jgi:hypothetical protein
MLWGMDQFVTGAPNITEFSRQVILTDEPALPFTAVQMLLT